MWIYCAYFNRDRDCKCVPLSKYAFLGQTTVTLSSSVEFELQGVLGALGCYGGKEIHEKFIWNNVREGETMTSAGLSQSWREDFDWREGRVRPRGNVM